jgi:hypothetical protein
MANPKVWKYMIRTYAAMLAIFGVFLAIFSIYISLPDGSENSKLGYMFLIMMPIAVIYIWIGYKAARKLTTGSIRLLTVVTLFLILNKIIDANRYLVSHFVEPDTEQLMIASALAIPVAFILYFVTVKTVARLAFGKSTTEPTPNNSSNLTGAKNAPPS